MIAYNFKKMPDFSLYCRLYSNYPFYFPETVEEREVPGYSGGRQAERVIPAGRVGLF